MKAWTLARSLRSQFRNKLTHRIKQTEHGGPRFAQCKGKMGPRSSKCAIYLYYLIMAPPQGGERRSIWNLRTKDEKRHFARRHASCPLRLDLKVKMSRAHGGCLGAGSRRRARQAAIRPGEAQTAFDPGVPEWGNPAGVMPRYPGLNA